MVWLVLKVSLNTRRGLVWFLYFPKMAGVSLISQFPSNSVSFVSRSKTTSIFPVNSISFPKVIKSNKLVFTRKKLNFSLRAAGEDNGETESTVGVAVAEEEPYKEPTEIDVLKKQLVDLFYGTNRGLSATSETRAEVVELITLLEAKNPTPEPTQALTLLNGKWILA